jgi:hypothetical protein
VSYVTRGELVAAGVIEPPADGEDAGDRSWLRHLIGQSPIDPRPGTFLHAVAALTRIASDVEVLWTGGKRLVPHAVLGAGERPGEVVLYFLGAPPPDAEAAILDALRDEMPVAAYLAVRFLPACIDHEDCRRTGALGRSCYAATDTDPIHG